MSQDALFAFVLMPFDEIFDDRYRLGIKETAKNLGILAERVDEQIYREGILDRIYRQIEVADIVIADMTGKNPNVFYEVVRRLAPGAWAQVRFSTDATLAYSVRGQEIKDSYRLTGKSVLRIVTSEGNFDHEIAVDALIEEFPF